MSPPHHEAIVSPVRAGETPQRGKSSGVYVQGGQLSSHIVRTQVRQRSGDPGTYPIPSKGTAVLGLPPVTRPHITKRQVWLMHGRFPAP